MGRISFCGSHWGELRIYTWLDGVCFLENRKRVAGTVMRNVVNRNVEWILYPSHLSHTKKNARVVSERQYVTNVGPSRPLPNQLVKLKYLFLAQKQNHHLYITDIRQRLNLQTLPSLPDLELVTLRNFSKSPGIDKVIPSVHTSFHFPFLHIHRDFPSLSPVSEGPPPLSPPRPLMEQYIRRLRFRKHLILKLNQAKLVSKTHLKHKKNKGEEKELTSRYPSRQS